MFESSLLVCCMQMTASASKGAEVVKLKKQIASALEDSEVAVRAAQRQVHVTQQGLSSLQMRVQSELGFESSVSLGSPGDGGGGSGGGAEVATERVLEMVRTFVQTWQQEKKDLSQRLADATMSLESLEAERNAAREAVTRHREIATGELQSQRAAAAAAEATHLAELEAQSVQMETIRRERESWQAVREKVRRK
eukprot:COSAG02_NODE_2189_length_9564_cov_10.112097_4_plen_195_part_00